MALFGESFDHNLHALRIVESFEQRYARFPGLNLTFEVREGIVKHSRDLEPGENPSLAEYLPGLRPPLEAQLIDFADEVAYNTADLDDAFSAGMITLEEIATAVPNYASILAGVRRQWPDVPQRLQFQEVLRLLIDLLVTGLINGTLRAATEAGVKTTGDVRRHPARLACFLPAASETAQALKRFLHARVYNSPLLLAERERASGMISELFQFYLHEPARMPSPYSEQIANQPLHQVVCDYIAGMTDGFFERTYRQVLG
jgi:dGTPase